MDLFYGDGRFETEKGPTMKVLLFIVNFIGCVINAINLTLNVIHIKSMAIGENIKPTLIILNNCQSP